jgi:hypothetical protein
MIILRCISIIFLKLMSATTFDKEAEFTYQALEEDSHEKQAAQISLIVSGPSWSSYMDLRTHSSSIFVGGRSKHRAWALITAHGSVSGRQTLIDHCPHRVIHPCPVELTVDVLLQNLILKQFTSALTAHDLCLLRQMLEEIPSSFTVLSNRASENPRESQVMLQPFRATVRAMATTTTMRPIQMINATTMGRVG